MNFDLRRKKNINTYLGKRLWYCSFIFGENLTKSQEGD